MSDSDAFARAASAAGAVAGAAGAVALAVKAVAGAVGARQRMRQRIEDIEAWRHAAEPAITEISERLARVDERIDAQQAQIDQLVPITASTRDAVMETLGYVRALAEAKGLAPVTTPSP